MEFDSNSEYDARIIQHEVHRPRHVGYNFAQPATTIEGVLCRSQ